MHPYPHVYQVSARGSATAMVEVRATGLPSIATAPPPQFDGPEGVWSPETLLCAAIADCFVLTFRAVARAARLDWLALECQVEGTLEKADGVTRFTRFVTHAALSVRAGTDDAKAKSLLERAEHSCLISNSLSGARSLTTEVTTSAEPAPSTSSVPD